MKCVSVTLNTKPCISVANWEEANLDVSWHFKGGEKKEHRED